MRTLLVVAVLAAVRALAVEPGTAITADNVAEAEQLLLPGEVDAVRRGMRIEVVESQRVGWRKAYRLATEKNAGQARIGPAGELLDYVAGLPFPNIEPDDPDIAHKIVWNYAFGPWIADDAQAWSFQWETGTLRDGAPMRRESGENQDGEQSKWLRLVGRTEVPPIPAFPDNPSAVMTMHIFGPTLPVFLTVVRSGPMLVYRYLPLKEDDVWYYTGWDRKGRRIPARIRYEAFGDVVIDLNSSFGLDVPHGAYTWRFVGERELLGVVHAREYPARWCPGAGDFAPCDVWEKRRVFVVEGQSTLPYDTYGKRVVAFDREAWVVLATDLYDRDGKRWKTWMNFWSHRPYARGGAEAETMPYLLAGSGIDFEDRKAIRWRLPGTRSLADAVKINSGLTPNDFNPQNLGSAFTPSD
jgi:uncharacterized protein DUF1329